MLAIRRHHHLAGAVAILLSAGLAFAQADKTAGGQDVLKKIPAGSMAFVLVNNVGTTTGNVDSFIKAISPSPDQPLLPGSILDMIKSQLSLGEGLNVAGGFGVVMLDPQQYGIDLVGAVTGGAKFDPTTLPIVIIVPGTDPMKLFADRKPAKEGEAVKFNGSDGSPRYAIQSGAYVLVSPNLKAAQAVAAGGKSVELSKASSDLLLRNDLSVWLNIKMAQPLLDAAIVKMQKDPGTGTTVAGAAFPVEALGTWNDIAKQVVDVAAGARVEKSGLMIEFRTNYAPGSDIAKTLAATKAGTAPLLNRLPNMPYIMAIGVAGYAQQPREQRAKPFEAMFKQEPFKQLDPKLQTKLRDGLLDLGDQVTGAQVYVGGLTTGTGKVGVSIVLECQDTGKVRDSLAGLVEVAKSGIESAPDADLKKLTVAYNKEQETVGAVKADTITLTHPEMANMPPDASKAMVTILGEDKVVIRVVPAGKLLVLTFGGAADFAATAVKVATDGSGTLEKDAETAAVLANMPKERNTLMLLNVGNIFTVVKDIATSMGETNLPFSLGATPPVALTGGVDGTAQTGTIFVPSATVREVVKTVMGVMMKAMMGGMGAMEATPPMPMP